MSCNALCLDGSSTAVCSKIGVSEFACYPVDFSSRSANERHPHNIAGKISMKTTLFISILVAFALSNAFAAPEWKPYDDFEGELDAIDETPGQIPALGTKWVQFVPENRLEMGNREWCVSDES